MNAIHFVAADLNSRPAEGCPAGNINFSQDCVYVEATAGGAALRLGYSISITHEIEVSLSNFTAEISLLTAGGKLPLGVAIDSQTHLLDTTRQFQSGKNSTINGELRLPLTMAALETIQRRRKEGDIAFDAAISGLALVCSKPGGHCEACKVEIDGGAFHPIQIRVARERWVSCLRSIAKLGSVLVEIPLSPTREAPWDTVWKHLENASKGLSEGGASGWKSCVMEVRQGIEAWKKAEPFSTERPQAQTKPERIQAVANALFNFCSLAAHADKHPSSWDRADAICAVACLSALLAARGP